MKIKLGQILSFTKFFPSNPIKIYVSKLLFLEVSFHKPCIETMSFVNNFSTFHVISDRVVKKSKNTCILANHDEVKCRSQPPTFDVTYSCSTNIVITPPIVTYLKQGKGKGNLTFFLRS